MNKIVKEYFDTNPAAQEVHSTSDGNLFTAGHYAEAYAATLKDKKVTKHDRAEYAAAALNDTENPDGETQGEVADGADAHAAPGEEAAIPADVAGPEKPRGKKK